MQTIKHQQLFTFLKQINADVSTLPLGIWCFQGSDYPLLFFTLFFRRLEALQSKKYQMIDGAESEFPELCAQLATSFLGQTSSYWLKNISSSDARTKKLLFSYQGPHQLAFFIDEEVTIEQSLAMVIKIESTVTKEQYQELYTWLYGQAAHQTTLDSLFAKQAIMPLETACLLMQYQPVVGRHLKDFTEQIVEKLVVPEKSLFLLSQLFFSKNSSEFFKLWHLVEIDYPQEFWVVYWSEQLWQAYIFIQALPTQGPVEAKKLVYRLPFSFMQKDWKLYKSTELINAHDFLYTLDHYNKNGAGSYGLEVFYHKFLHGHFKRI